MKKVFAMLLAVLLLSSMACGQKAGTVETQETAAPVATEAPKAEAQAVRQVGVYDVVANDGAKAGTEAYPYMVMTKYSVWYLASADIELQGEDAFFAGLAEVLQYFDEDVADARDTARGDPDGLLRPGRRLRERWGLLQRHGQLHQALPQLGGGSVRPAP